MPPKTDRIMIIAGPTASGKSALALDRAGRNNGVIINADSRQVYDALPLLTAQPSASEKEAVPHALYGTLHPNTACSAGNWVEMARPVISKALEDGQTPIVTGGTGLYLKALMEGLSPIPDVPPEIRAQAAALQKDIGNPAFYDALQKRDPQTAALYHPHHTARLVHAWEVLEATGKPLAYWQSLPKEGPPPHWMFDVTLVLPDRETLYRRCDARFIAMMEAGAEDELAAFDARAAKGEILPTSPALKTIGADPLRALRSGEISRDEAITRAQTQTRQYAKRQVTWFRHQIRSASNIRTIENLG